MIKPTGLFLSVREGDVVMIGDDIRIDVWLRIQQGKNKELRLVVNAPKSMYVDHKRAPRKTSTAEKEAEK